MRHHIMMLLSGSVVAIGISGKAAAGDPETVLYRGATVLTVHDSEISDADLLVRGGKIIAIGNRGQVEVPDGTEIRDLTGRVIIPGLVDTHSHIGIYPRPSIDAHSDGNEMSGAVQPGIRALDAIWPGDPGIRMATAGGVTTANIMPGSGNAIGGQTLYVKLRSGTLEQMMFDPGRPEGGLKMANGENPKRSYGAKNQPPNTRMRLAALQREQFVKAQDYQRKWQAYRAAEASGADKKPPKPERDLALESLVEVLERRRTVHFHSHRADDIRTVIRLSDEFGFELVLQHGTEAYKIADELAKRHIPVSLTIPDSPGGKAEVADLIEQAAALLTKAGVKIAVNTDDYITESRFLLRTAAITVRGGLTEDLAIKALTLWPAEMLHLDRHIGSIEPGKDADFVVLSGRPFSVYTQVLETYIDGVRVFDRASPDANYAIGGFTVSDSDARPKPTPPIQSIGRVQPPKGDSQATIPAGAKRIAIRAGRVDTAAGSSISNGLIVVDAGRIVYVGRSEGFVVPDDLPQLSVALATPGFIDCHSVVGVSGFYNSAADQDQDELSDPNQSDVHVLDSFNPAEPLLQFSLEHGVTLVQACPGRSNVIAGQAGIFRTHGTTVDAMTVRFPSALIFNLGEVPKRTYPGKAPTTRMATAAMIRSALVSASNYQLKQAAKGDAPGDRNLKHEALAQVIDRKIPAVFSAHRADDIQTALRLIQEFQLVGQLDLATEGYLIADPIARARVPVLLHPTMQRISSPETLATTLENAAILGARGIPLSITSSFEGYVPKTRSPLYEAAIAAVNGLGYDRAIQSITIDAARILGVDRDYGSIERGKVADLVLFDGDPFEYSTHVTHVLVDGQVVYDRTNRPKATAGWGSGGGFIEYHCCDTAF